MLSVILCIRSFVKLKANSNVRLIINLSLSAPNLCFLMVVITKSTWKPMIVEILVLLQFLFQERRQVSFRGVFSSTISDSQFLAVLSPSVLLVMKWSFLSMEKNTLAQRKTKKLNWTTGLLFVQTYRTSAGIGITVVMMIVMGMGSAWLIENANVDIFTKGLLVLRLLSALWKSRSYAIS